MPGPVCRFCQRLLPGSIQSPGPPGKMSNRQIANPGDVEHYPNFRAFINSSKNCTLCKLILDHLIIRTGQEYVDERVAECPEGCAVKYLLCLQSPHVRNRIQFTMCIFGIVSHTPPERECKTHPFLQLSILRMVTENYKQVHIPYWSALEPFSTEDNLSLVSNWVTECDHSHEKCPVPSHSQSEMPARLIQVKPTDPNSSPNTLQLVQVSSLSTPSQEIKYAALSHCWGDPTSLLQTTSQNLQDHMQEIPFSTLPQSFQDAVTVTRKLGIPYLWIDSLCIIQGDAQDWEVEAAKMGSLYQNAYLTIAATKASGSTEGLFIHYTPTLQLEVSTPDNSLGKSIHLYVRPWVWFELTPERSPLLRRAWVFQEMMLSRRTIHFTEEQIYWSCGTCRASENGTWDAQTSVFDTFNSQHILSQSLKQDHSQLMRAWCSIAVGYSRGALTFTKDKFPALAGIIQKLQDATGEVPLAGYWKSSILSTLDWRVRRPLAEPKNPGIPSWSWASVNAEIELGAVLNQNLQAELLDCNVEWSGAPHSSSITNATLTIRAVLIPATLSTGTDNKRDTRIRFGIGPNPYTGFHSTNFPDTDWELGDGEVACLFLSERKYVCIVLQETGRVKDEYRRVGHGRAHSEWVAFAGAEEIWGEDRRRVFTIV